VKDRLPVVLSATALVVAVFGVTPVGQATSNAVQTHYARNASFLRGKAPSVTAGKNKVPVAAANGKLHPSWGAVGPRGPLNDVILVVKSSAAIAAGGVGAETVQCPAGYLPIAGGVDPNNVLNMRVTSSAPTTAASARMAALGDGQYKPTGWHGAAYNEAGAPAQGFKVGVLCAKT
jgi:hypothetical protein